MDKEIYIYKIEYYSAMRKNKVTICKKREGTGNHRIKKYKPDSERQVLHIFAQLKPRGKKVA
jgi:hypothetical protein